MAAITGETGLQFLERFQERPSLCGLNPYLFNCGPKSQELIEIFGEYSTGKTLLITSLIKTAILPKNCNGVPLVGLEAEAVLLNCDLHFSIEKLADMMYVYLKQCLPSETVPNQAASLIKETVDNALKRITILNIYSSDSMHVTFHLLKKLILINTKISLIVCDSISAYYWQDRILPRVSKMDLYIQNILKCLHQCISCFHVTVIFTRPSYFQSGNSVECSPVYDLRNVNTSINLKIKRRNNGCVYYAEIKTSSSLAVKFFKINDSGIIWLD